MQTVNVKVPIWAKDIEDQGVLCLIAFIYRVSVQHGYHDWGMYKSDVSTILGKKLLMKDWITKEWPECKQWLTITPTTIGKTYLKLKEIKTSFGAKENSTEMITLTDPRAVLIWVYLLGAFNRNLITDEVFPKHEHGMFREDRLLFNYFGK